MSKKFIVLTSFMMVLLPNLVTTVNAADQRIVGWWKLDDGTGTVAMDSSANGQNGTLLNEPTWDSAGMQGGCLQFDGTNDRVNITGTWTIPQYTVSLWFKQDAAVTVQKDLFSLENQTVAVGAGGILMEVGTDGRLRFLHRAPFSGTGGAAMESLYTPAVTTGVWHHWAVVKTATDMISYVDGILAGTQANPNLFDTPGDTVTIGDIDSRQMRPWNGLIDDVRIYNAALSDAEIKQVMENKANVTASNPQPRNRETDVARDVTLGWTPGSYADTHNVFFGTDFNDVNDATVGDTLGVTVAQGLALDVNYFDPGTLELETTYYWRVDEVNAPPDTDVVYKGEVWSFTTEVQYLKVPASDITVEAKNNKSDPNNTINEVGLDLPNNPDQHSSSAGLWQSGATNGPTDLLWIRYDFAKTYKLHEMLVWNMNNKPLLTLGFKQVRIEYLPPDSNEWTILTEMEFAKGAGTNGYVYNTTVPFNDTVAKAVRLTMINNWGGKDTSGALSEIRFKYIPTYARLPQPETGTTDVSVASSVSWRAGREAVSHNVYIDTNEDAVKNGTAAANPANTNSYSPSLSFGRTYYWRVDEINNSMTPSVWKGDIWSFTTQEYKSIEDFEDYNDFPGSLIYETWLDGLTNTALGGSVVGHEVAPFAEKTIVPPGSRQSLPLYYNNTAAGTNTSIAERTFDGTENMSANGADTLVLYYRGRAVTFQQASDGSIAMSGEGSDISGTADQFRFAYKTMTGNGSITVRVDSIENANAWSKAGIMIRNSLDADDMHAAVILGANGTSQFQRRSAKGGTTTNSDVAGLGSPCWVRLTRSGDDFTAQRSKDGNNWLSFETDANLPSKVTIDMGNVAYIGLVVTSHTADVLAAATFYSVSTSNNVTGSTWTVAAIGDTSQAEGGNTLDALYVSLSDSAGKSAKVYAPLLSAVGSGSWQKWEIPTSQFTGVDRTKIKKISIGVGNTAAPLKGNGLVYIDNITLGHALEQ